MSKINEALRLIADIAEGSTTANSLQHIAKIAREALAEQPAQRCPLCNYQHGHAIGCENNPVDIALAKMAEQPAQQQGADPYGEAMLAAWDSVRDPGPAGDDVPHPVFTAGFKAGWDAKQPAQQQQQQEPDTKDVVINNMGRPFAVKAYTSQQPAQQQEPTVEDNSQNWRGMDGTTAYWLIQRHADGWSDIGKMMGEWLEANQTQPAQQQEPVGTVKAKRGGGGTFVHWTKLPVAGMTLYTSPQPAQPAQQQEPVANPYAYEYGRDNGDGTYSVVIEKGDLVQTAPAVYNYVRPRNAHKDWPIKELFDHPPAQHQEPVAHGNAEDLWAKQSKHLNCPICDGSGHVEDIAQRNFEFFSIVRQWKDGLLFSKEAMMKISKQFPPASKPLTDDDLDDIAVAARIGNLYDLRLTIEAKLREKNA